MMELFKYKDERHNQSMHIKQCVTMTFNQHCSGSVGGSLTQTMKRDNNNYVQIKET